MEPSEASAEVHELQGAYGNPAPTSWGGTPLPTSVEGSTGNIIFIQVLSVPTPEWISPYCPSGSYFTLSRSTQVGRISV